MTTKAAKAAAAAAAAGDVKKPDELTPENTVDGDGGQNTAAGSGDTRKAVFFLGPYHRYSRGDTACFDAEYAEKLVERHIAVWPEDAEKALSPRKGADDHDTDIG